jgi:hypothetical protein
MPDAINIHVDHIPAGLAEGHIRIGRARSGSFHTSSIYRELSHCQVCGR